MKSMITWTGAPRHLPLRSAINALGYLWRSTAHSPQSLHAAAGRLRERLPELSVEEVAAAAQVLETRNAYIRLITNAELLNQGAAAYDALRITGHFSRVRRSAHFARTGFTPLPGGTFQFRVEVDRVAGVMDTNILQVQVRRPVLRLRTSHTRRDPVLSRWDAARVAEIERAAYEITEQDVPVDACLLCRNRLSEGRYGCSVCRRGNAFSSSRSSSRMRAPDPALIAAAEIAWEDVGTLTLSMRADGGTWD